MTSAIRTLKVVFVFLVSALFLNGNASASTNFLWQTVVPLIDYSNTPPSQILSDLEMTSKRLDPKGRGIRIVYDKGVLEPSHPISIKMEKASIYDILISINYICTEARRKIFLVDDVALLCWQLTEGPPVFRLFGLHGKLVDDCSCRTVTNRLTVIGSDLCATNQLYFLPDGTFFLNVLCEIRRPFISGLEISDFNENIVELEINVPEYVKRRMSVSLDYNLTPIEIAITPLENRGKRKREE